MNVRIAELTTESSVKLFANTLANRREHDLKTLEPTGQSDGPTAVGGLPPSRCADTQRLGGSWRATAQTGDGGGGGSGGAGGGVQSRGDRRDGPLFQDRTSILAPVDAQTNWTEAILRTRPMAMNTNWLRLCPADGASCSWSRQWPSRPHDGRSLGLVRGSRINGVHPGITVP